MCIKSETSVSPVRRIHGAGDKRVEVGGAQFTIVPNYPLRYLVLSILANLGSAELEVLVPKEGMLLSGPSKGPIELQMRKGFSILTGLMTLVSRMR